MQSACALSRRSSPRRWPARTSLLFALALFPFAPGAAAATAQSSQSGGADFRSAAFDAASFHYTPGTNPRKFTCRSREEAEQLGATLASATGAEVLLTSGTRSMEPLIHGKAYVVVHRRPYEGITSGELLIYQGRPDANKPDRVCMLHRAVLRDRGGWLMSGDNNRWSESWDRVTPATYQGTVTAIVEFPQV